MESTLAENNRPPYDTPASSVAWSAIIAGAFTAAVVSLILLLLGSGLGLASVSPWENAGITITTFTLTTAAWLITMQLISAGLGGYLTGRLRRKWVGMHTDEVFFRDTAHGFLAWALATTITATLLASAAASVIGGSAKAVTTIAVGAAAGTGYSAAENADDASYDPTAYFVDSLYRSGFASQDPTDVRGETMRILINGAKNDAIPDADKDYLAKLVAAKTGFSAPEADERVDNVLEQIEAAKMTLKEEADKARKVTAGVSIFTFLSLLIGAFIASAAAALGGRHRDTY